MSNEDTIEEKDIWILRWEGPVKCKLMYFYPNCKKNVIEINDVPSVVDVSDCFESRVDCYRAAVAREMKIAESKFKAAGEFAAKVMIEE